MGDVSGHLTFGHFHCAFNQPRSQGSLAPVPTERPGNEVGFQDDRKGHLCNSPSKCLPQMTASVVDKYINTSVIFALDVEREKL